MRRTVEIERKEWTARRTAKAMREQLSAANAHKRWISVSEAVALTGVPVHLAEPALLLLAGATKAELRSTDAGELEFKFKDLSSDVFAFSLPPRLKVWTSAATAFAKDAGRMLVGFTGSSLAGLTFMALTALAMRMGGFGLTLAVPLLIMGMFLCLPLAIIPMLVMFGQLLLESAATSLLDLAGMTLIVSPLALIFVLGLFVMGRWYAGVFERVAPWALQLANFGGDSHSELDDEAEFGQLVRANQGRVTLGDLMILFGWTRDEAFERATRLAVDYDGDVEVDDSGQIIFRFRRLGRTASLREERPRPIWERERPPLERLGVAGRRAGPMTLVGWAFAAAGLGMWARGLEGTALLTKMLETMPSWAPHAVTAGGLLFAAVPVVVLLRAIVVRWRQARYTKRAHQLEALRRIVEASGRVEMPLDDVEAQVVFDFDGEVDEDSAEGQAVEVRFAELEGVASAWRSR